MLGNLPDDASYEDIQYHLYVLEKVKRGLERAQSEGTIPHDAAKITWQTRVSGKRQDLTPCAFALERQDLTPCAFALGLDVATPPSLIWIRKTSDKPALPDDVS